ncbi:MAG: tetratricopeptide repeat protein [Clostridiales bacterium]|nr:tetratricopeptide repeat protein [Clostridiales bacterium]
MSAEKNGKKKPILRIVSLALVITLLCSVVATQFDEISRFVSVIAEDDPLSRIYSILQQGISEPQTYDDYYQLASIAIGKGEYDQALQHLEKCAELADEGDTAKLSDLSLKKASLYMLMQDYDSALPALESALSLDPKSSQALLLRAQIELDREEFLPAARDMESYLELVPEDTSLRATLAQVYEQLGRFVDASECYEAIYALNPTDAIYRLNALRCLFLAGNYEEALAGFDLYLGDAGEPTSVQPTEVGEEVPVETESGNAEQENETEATEPESAEPETAEPVADPLKATAYFLRAACKTQLTRYAEAVLDFESAIVYGYDQALCLEQLVTNHYAQEDFEAALEAGERLLALNSASIALDTLYQRMGVAAMSLERYEEAVDYLTKSIEANPELIGNAYYRGVSLLALERQAEAIPDFTRSIEQGYLVQFCYYNRGVCEVQLLDYESALDDMEMTLTSGDEQSLKDAATNILWQLAQYYENQKLQQNQGIEAEQIIE